MWHITLRTSEVFLEDLCCVAVFSASRLIFRLRLVVVVTSLLMQNSPLNRIIQVNIQRHSESLRDIILNENS